MKHKLRMLSICSLFLMSHFSYTQQPALAQFPEDSGVAETEELLEEGEESYGWNNGIAGEAFEEGEDRENDSEYHGGQGEAQEEYEGSETDDQDSEEDSEYREDIPYEDEQGLDPDAVYDEEYAPEEHEQDGEYFDQDIDLEEGAQQEYEGVETYDQDLEQFPDDEQNTFVDPLEEEMLETVPEEDSFGEER